MLMYFFFFFKIIKFNFFVILCFVLYLKYTIIKMTKDNHTALCVFILIMCCLCKSSVHWYCSCTTYCACFSVLVTFVTYFSSELPPNYSHLFFSFLFPFILHRTILCSLLVLCVTIPSKDINRVLCA